VRIESLGAVWAVLLVGVSSPAAVLSLISSQNFGSLALNTGAPGSATLTFQISSSPSSFQLQYGGDFSLGRHACTGAAPYTCTVTLSFAPQYPGLRQDAVRVLDSGGNVLATTLLYGLGLAPQAVLRPGVLTSFAGTGTLGNSGDNGAAVRAELSNPQGVAVDGAGNVYLADSLAQVIRKVNAATGMITTVVGPANSAGLNAPTGIAVDGAGNLYIADSQNNQIRKLDAVSGLITTVAGTGAVSASLGDGNLATQASLHNPSDVAVDPPGNLYIADEYNNRIRRVDAGTGVITTVAGGGTPGRGADGIGDAGPAVNAVLSDPSSVAFDSAGNLYIADSGNNLIREVNNGTISVVAGNGSPAYSGDNGAATQASLNQPSSVRVDAAGNLYIVDSHNNVIRQVNGAGIISSAVAAGQLNNPGGIAIDPSGNIYIADQGNSLVREITSGSAVLNFGATGVGTVSSPQIVSIDNIGNQALAIGGLSLTESFLQQSSGAMDCSLDVTVAPAASCSVAVAFVPQSASSFTGDLSLLTNSLNGTSLSLQVVALSGSGTGTGNESSDPAVNTVDLVFPYQTVGAASASQVVTLQNPGSTTVNVTGIWIAGSNAGDFSLNSTCQSTLAAHGTCTVSVVFTPQAAGARSATLSLTETGAVSGAQFTQSVFLQGIAAGMPGAITITPSVAFGTQAVGTVSSAQTVTLTNSSSVGLTIAGASLSGSSDFSISSNSCTSLLHPNNSCNVVLAFSPTVIGQEQASLEFTDQAGNSPQTVTVQGTGAIPILKDPQARTWGRLAWVGPPHCSWPLRIRVRHYI
jgi:sugar lactone lactonase YvrE